MTRAVGLTLSAETPGKAVKLLVGLIGAGIQGSLSPALHEEEARYHGLRLHYQLIDLDVAGVGVEALPGLVQAARLMGFACLNITYPCKQAVIPLLDELSEEARAIGAVNTVVINRGRLVGHNTDGTGWSWGFQRALPGANLARVVLLGAGGAGSACADAVLRLGARRLVIVDRETARAEELADRMCAIHGSDSRRHRNRSRRRPEGRPRPDSRHADRHDEASRHSAAGSAAAAGHLGFGDRLRAAGDAAARAARRAGCRTMDGGHMNVGQAVRGFKLFTGLDADPARMEAHFRRLVA